MNKNSERTMKFIFIPYFLVALPSMAVAADPAKQTPTASVINMALPIHQQKKLHPELSDPVLGDQAAIVEWAWSPQYAKRFNLPVQPDGLKDGGLWLIGVKVFRKQDLDHQRYACNIVGLLDSKLPIRTPPGEMYSITPGYGWLAGIPGFRGADPIKGFTPGQAAWVKKPKSRSEEMFPESSLTLSYLVYYRHFQPNLDFFEIEGACGYFRDPATHRNEIGFPGLVEGKSDADGKRSAFSKSSAIKFDIADGLMRRIYPYTVEADDWSSCLMHRLSASSLTTRALVTKRFGNACDPVIKSQSNR